MRTSVVHCKCQQRNTSTASVESMDIARESRPHVFARDMPVCNREPVAVAVAAMRARRHVGTSRRLARPNDGDTATHSCGDNTGNFKIEL